MHEEQGARLCVALCRAARAWRSTHVCTVPTLRTVVDHPSQVARFIYESLQTTPWNLTKSFVETHLQGWYRSRCATSRLAASYSAPNHTCGLRAAATGGGSGLLKLSGAGDPSGRGEGFSYLRHQLQRTRQPSVRVVRACWLTSLGPGAVGWLASNPAGA